MKEIQLSKQGKNKGKFVAFVDDEDYEYLNIWRWCVSGKKIPYVATCQRINGVKITLLMHRLIMNTPEGIEVDHIDHNGLNNQRNNLRNCTKSQNQMNRKSTGKSKYLGVIIHKNKYIFSLIKTNKKRIYLGHFKTEEEAALAYNKAAIKLHGEFAKLNDVTSGIKSSFV